MARIIIHDIITAFIQYVPYAITSGVIVITAICMIYAVSSGNTLQATLAKQRKKLALYYVTYIYCFSVAFITFLSREPGSRDRLDLRLFSTFSKSFSNNIYPVENIILFIPLGILLPFLWKYFRKIGYCMAAGFLFSFLIELSQYVTKRGFCQIDDIMTNTVGAIIGFGLYEILFLVRKIIRQIKRK